MNLMAEIGVKQIHKVGEELCGDTVEIIHKDDGLVLVLSDGLGSGVKANILSTLTAKIASKMISSNTDIKDVVETLIGTLPVCNVRGVAYSTFTIIQLHNNGWAHLVDFDGCDVVHIKKDGISLVERLSYDVGGREIHEANIRLQEGELLVAVSDGVIHAGMGDMFPAGLGSDGLMDLLERYVNPKDSVEDIASKIVSMCNSFYFEEPKDDTTAVVLRIVEERRLVLLTGPPKDRGMDKDFIAHFQALEGKKIICGGTTSQIYAKESGNPLHMDSQAFKDGTPPTAWAKGVDLITEGIITLNKVVDSSETMKEEGGQSPSDKVVAYLQKAHHITILLGSKENPAYKGQHMMDLDLRQTVVERLVRVLENQGKIVEVYSY